MRLLIVDPHLKLSSPSMKGVVRSLPAFKEAGMTVEAWCWECDPGLPVDRVVKLPRFGNVRLVGLHAFAVWSRLLAWWRYSVKKEARPDIIYTIAWYLPRCDVAHVHFSPFDWGRRQKVLGIATLRDAVERVLNVLDTWIARRALRATTAKLVLSVSESVAQDMRDIAPQLPIQVLPNSYDAQRFHPAVRTQWRESTRAKLVFTPDDHVFLFVSTGHYRRKGFFLAVQSIELLRKVHPQARLLVVGGSEERLRGLQEKLEAKHPAWHSWITFTGMVPDVEKYVAASDGFLFPSYSEAFALVEVEAAATGLPLFLTRHHGTEMIMDEGVNGRFIEFDAQQIAQVLGEFVSGTWQPSRMHVKKALDAAAYSNHLTQALLSVAPDSSGKAGSGATDASTPLLEEAHVL